MRQKICNVLDLVVRPLKLKVLKAKEYAELIRLNSSLISIYNARCKWEKLENQEGVCVVFSKDRAMQLHAFLSSFRDKVQPLPVLHILYTTSTNEHQQSYEELQALSLELPVKFYRQTGRPFREDLIDLLKSFTQSKIIFFVDDIVITEEINLCDFLKFDTDKFVASLRMGENISKNYTVNRAQPLPRFHDDMITGPDKIAWQWQDGVLDWGYPLSVDGHVFSRQEFLAMLNLLNFSAPNTLEDALQTFKPLFSERFGVAYRKSRLLNIPWNKVQNENRNLAGEIHQDELLKKWQAGLAIDLQKIYGYNNHSPHEEIEIQFVKRMTEK